MSEASANIVIIGECMLEISSSVINSNQSSTSPSINAFVNYGGDTINTAVYLARQNIAVSYASALGDDSISQWLLSQWQTEGVNCDLVNTIAGKLPGLYMIENDANGERFFHYWRENSAAKKLFNDSEKLNQLYDSLNSLPSKPWFYLSGITLALYSDKTREGLYHFLKEYRETGRKVIFDSNYRSQLWASKQQAQDNYQRIYSLTDIALPTLEDEQALFEEDNKEQVIKRIASQGVKEIILKMGDVGCMIINDDGTEKIVANKVVVIDTTAAGDSFNAGYLAARINKLSCSEAVEEGQNLAAKVIQHKGAIIDKSLM